MPDDDDEIELTATAVDTPMDFDWRLTSSGDGKLIIEVGDKFELSPMMAKNVESMTAQVGVSALLKSCRLMGLSKQEAKAIATVAYQLSNEDDVE